MAKKQKATSVFKQGDQKLTFVFELDPDTGNLSWKLDTTKYDANKEEESKVLRLISGLFLTILKISAEEARKGEAVVTESDKPTEEASE